MKIQQRKDFIEVKLYVIVLLLLLCCSSVAGSISPIVHIAGKQKKCMPDCVPAKLNANTDNYIIDTGRIRFSVKEKLEQIMQLTSAPENNYKIKYALDDSGKTAFEIRCETSSEKQILDTLLGLYAESLRLIIKHYAIYDSSYWYSRFSIFFWTKANKKVTKTYHYETEMTTAADEGYKQWEDEQPVKAKMDLIRNLMNHQPCEGTILQVGEKSIAAYKMKIQPSLCTPTTIKRYTKMAALLTYAFALRETNKELWNVRTAYTCDQKEKTIEFDINSPDLKKFRPYLLTANEKNREQGIVLNTFNTGNPSMIRQIPIRMKEE